MQLYCRKTSWNILKMVRGMGNKFYVTIYH